MDNSAPRDDNFEVAIFGISADDPDEREIIPIAVDPATGAILIEEAP